MVVSFYSVNEFKITFLAKILVPVSAEMVPGERSSVCEPRTICEKIQKKFENLTLDNKK
jgi:hypothetical protein